MQEVNGFAALLPDPLDLEESLRAMAYRAWSGFSVGRLGDLGLGLCLMDDDTGGLPAVHGEIYGNGNKIEQISEAGGVADLLARSDGSYSLVLPADNKLIFARDPLGTKPLYYASEGKRFGIASDARVLRQWFGGVTEAEPGVLYSATQTLLERTRFSPFGSIRPERAGSGAVIRKVSDLLTEAVRRRTVGRARIVLGFSGGIDSTVLAVLASKHANLTAATVCVEGSVDHGRCPEIAERLGISLRMIVIDEKIIKDTLRRLAVIAGIQGAMHLSIACVVHILAKFAKESGADALMLGQLADELFGGYARYLRFARNSAKRAGDAILDDVMNAHRSNFWRDEIAASPYTRLLLPYASLDLVQYALNIPLKMKLDAGTGRRKIVLREVARSIGVDDDLAELDKKAMQFSSGVHKIVNRLQS